jgi:hypothetical protein
VTDILRPLAFFRIALGCFAWIAPATINRIFGVPRSDQSPALDYMTRVFGVRAITLGIGYLRSSGSARDLWHRLWLLCDAGDTVMGVAMVKRGELGRLTGAQALLITGGATALDLAALARTSTGSAPPTADEVAAAAG